VKALRAAGHDVVAIDTARGFLPPGAEGTLIPDAAGTEPLRLEELAAMLRGEPGPALGEMPALRRTDVVFLALHGGAGEDGRLQALLDLVGVPYTGSGYLGSALAMDKQVSKWLFERAGIPTPAWRMAPADAATVAREIAFPVVVKPSKQGSTVGLTVVREPAALAPAIATAYEFDDEVLIEKYIEGRELTVGILGERALPVVEIRPKHAVYDYECKYTKGMSEYLVPAPLSDAQVATIQELGLRAHRVLKLSGFSRIDFRMDPAGGFYCLEANSLPGLTQTSLLPKAAAAAGISFPALCDQIVRAALESRGARGTGAEGGGGAPGE
ncbi:MAG: D-alanine--D-alanine ligase, partial [Gemmatimonadota bacterium]